MASGKKKAPKNKSQKNNYHNENDSNSRKRQMTPDKQKSVQNGARKSDQHSTGSKQSTKQEPKGQPATGSKQSSKREPKRRGSRCGQMFLLLIVALVVAVGGVIYANEEYQIIIERTLEKYEVHDKMHMVYDQLKSLKSQIQESFLQLKSQIAEPESEKSQRPKRDSDVTETGDFEEMKEEEIVEEIVKEMEKKVEQPPEKPQTTDEVSQEDITDEPETIEQVETTEPEHVQDFESDNGDTFEQEPVDTFEQEQNERFEQVDIESLQVDITEQELEQGEDEVLEIVKPEAEKSELREDEVSEPLEPELVEVPEQEAEKFEPEEANVPETLESRERKPETEELGEEFQETEPENVIFTEPEPEQATVSKQDAISEPEQPQVSEEEQNTRPVQPELTKKEPVQFTEPEVMKIPETETNINIEPEQPEITQPEISQSSEPELTPAIEPGVHATHEKQILEPVQPKASKLDQDKFNEPEPVQATEKEKVPEPAEPEITKPEQEQIERPVQPEITEPVPLHTFESEQEIDTTHEQLHEHKILTGKEQEKSVEQSKQKKADQLETVTEQDIKKISSMLDNDEEDIEEDKVEQFEEPKVESIREEDVPDPFVEMDILEQVEMEIVPEPMEDQIIPEQTIDERHSWEEDVLDPVVEVDIPDPVNVEIISEQDEIVQKPVREEVVSEPVKDKVVSEPEPVNDKVVPEPESVKDKVVSEPVNDKVVPEPESVKDKVVSEPVKDKAVSEPVKDKVVPEPVKDKMVPEPVKDKVVPEPVKDKMVPEPVKDKVVSEPVKDKVVSEPVKDKKVLEPVKDKVVSEPVKDKVVSEPVKDKVVSEPVKDKVVPEPVKDKMVPEPVKDKVVSEPVKDKVVSEPVKDKVVSEQKKDKVVQSTTGETKSDSQMSEKEVEKLRKKKEKEEYPKILITNSRDYRNRKRLDVADQLSEEGDFEGALEKYEKVIEKYPNSPRANYGKGLVLDQMAEKRQSNAYLEQAIRSLDTLLNIPDVPDRLLLLAGRRLAERQQFRGWGDKATKTWRHLVEKFPDDYNIRNQLGLSYILIGNMVAAKNAFYEVLSIHPTDGFAMVHLGFILKSSDLNFKDAIPLLQEGIATEEPGTEDGRFYFHLGEALQRTDNTEEAYKVYHQGAAKGLFLSADQRSLYNVWTLTSRPWWTAEETGYTKHIKLLEDNWKIIRDEALNLLDANTGSFLPEEENLRESGDWRQLTLYNRGRKDKENCNKAPKTCELIDQIPDAKECRRGQVKFSVMQPGVHVWPHCGPTNCRLRAHLGLVVPPGPKIRVVNETREWQEGKVFVFDDSFEHEVWHKGDKLRMVLIVDFWHPQLDQDTRLGLTPI